jgi:hypothetical protein
MQWLIDKLNGFKKYLSRVSRRRWASDPRTRILLADSIKGCNKNASLEELMELIGIERPDPMQKTDKEILTYLKKIRHPEYAAFKKKYNEWYGHS